MALKQHDARKSIARMAYVAGRLKADERIAPTINHGIQIDLDFEIWWKEHNVDAE